MLLVPFERVSLLNSEIGSEFWLEDCPIETHTELPRWLTKYGNTVLTSSGRGAITLLLQKVTPTSKTVLMPAYICHSVITPFIKYGYTCYFYEVAKDLTPKLESIESLENIGLFLHMGYFGYNTNSNLKSVLQELKKRSTIIVEDITHTLFSNFNRYIENDYYIGSIRKWLGVPSGGLLASTKTKLLEPNELHDEFIHLRKHALLLKGDYINNGDESLKELYLKKFEEAESLLEFDSHSYCIDPLSLSLIHSLDVDQLINKTRNNFQDLFKGLNELSFLSIPVGEVKDEVCTLFCPVIIKKNRDLVRKKLINEKIYVAIHWPIPEPIIQLSPSKTIDIYQTILSIPCDYRYEKEDMDRIISVMKSIEKSI